MASSTFAFLLFFFSLCSATAPSPKDIAFVRRCCKSTIYPSLCISYLTPYAGVVYSSKLQLAINALKVSSSKARSTANDLSNMGRSSGIGRKETQALNDCFEEFSESIDQLTQSTRELASTAGRIGKKKFLWHLNNVKTWVSGALTDENTCSDGFENTKMKYSIKREVTLVSHLTSNALALIDLLAPN